MMNFLFAQATALELVLMLALSFVSISRVYSTMGPILGISNKVNNLIKLGLGATTTLMVLLFDGFSSTLMVLNTLACAVPVMLLSTAQLEKLVQWSISPASKFNLVNNAAMAMFFAFAIVGEYMVNDTVAAFMTLSALGAAAGVVLNIRLTRLQRKAEA